MTPENRASLRELIEKVGEARAEALTEIEMAKASIAAGSSVEMSQGIIQHNERDLERYDWMIATAKGLLGELS